MLHEKKNKKKAVSFHCGKHGISFGMSFFISDKQGQETALYAENLEFSFVNEGGTEYNKKSIGLRYFILGDKKL